MMNGMKRVSATLAASISLAASALAATPASAQTGSGTGDPFGPTYCSYTPQGVYYCCYRWDGCQQPYFGDSARPEEPTKPSELPEE